MKNKIAEFVLFMLTILLVVIFVDSILIFINRGYGNDWIRLFPLKFDGVVDWIRIPALFVIPVSYIALKKVLYMLKHVYDNEVE